MACPHNFKFDSIYVLNCCGSCDNCGSPQRLDNVIGIYKGEYPQGHLFQIIPFSCPGCHRVVDSYNLAVPISIETSTKKDTK